MSVTVECIATLLALLACVPVAVFCLEVLVAIFPQKKRDAAGFPAGARLAVLIPAHNEQAVIAATLRTLLPTLPTGSRALVVADNCSDATAAVARDCGAEVVERSDANRRGKGFALDCGLAALAADPPDAVIFLDADCRVHADTVRLLGAAAIITQRPIQGLNLCDPDPSGGTLQIISGLAFRFKNLVRMLGLSRLAGVNHLTGTGMALPWALVERVKFADGNVVEDMQLGIDLTLANLPPLFLPAARVDSPLPQQRAAARTQRTRWEHGHLKTLLSQTPRLFALALKHRRPALVWLALDLAVPPLSLLVFLLSGLTALAAAMWLCNLGSSPLAILTIADVSLVIAVLLGWAIHCRQQVSASALFVAPFYALAKLPIYAAFLWKRQSEWVRTQRDPARV